MKCSLSEGRTLPVAMRRRRRAIKRRRNCTKAQRITVTCAIDSQCKGSECFTSYLSPQQSALTHYPNGSGSFWAVNVGHYEAQLDAIKNVEEVEMHFALAKRRGSRIQSVFEIVSFDPLQERSQSYVLTATSAMRS